MVSKGASGARAVARCDLLGSAPYSDAPDKLIRTYLSPAHRATVDRVGAWMADAGMAARLDPAANLVGRFEGQTADAPALMIGSHLDSVDDAGRYDGPLGVMLGIECVAALQAAGRRLPFAIEVVGFGDEEGSRFPAAMLTSRAVAGTLDPESLRISDRDGVTLDQALGAFDSALAIDRYGAAARSAGAVLAYLEAHIEQGPVLEDAGLPLGTVTGIAAQRRYCVEVRGVAGHAGTTIMPLRRDALAGAAEMVLAIETVARAAQSDLVATVGRLEAGPGAANVIPGHVVFTIDVRAGDAARRDEAAEEMLATTRQIADRRGLSLAVELIHDLPPSPCDPRLMELMDAAIAAQGIAVRRLVSGAGHDAMTMAALCPTAMLFLRCAGGVSHNPAESVDPADADLAFAAMLHFIDRLAENYK